MNLKKNLNTYKLDKSFSKLNRASHTILNLELSNSIVDLYIDGSYLTKNIHHLIGYQNFDNMFHVLTFGKQ